MRTIGGSGVKLDYIYEECPNHYCKIPLEI